MDEKTKIIKNNIDWFKRFVDYLKDLIKKDPYRPFFFVSSISLILVISFGKYFDGRYFELIFYCFVYSGVGMVWRYITKDLIKVFGKCKDYLIAIYHIGNVVLILWLLIIIFLKA